MLVSLTVWVSGLKDKHLHPTVLMLVFCSDCRFVYVGAGNSEEDFD